MKRGWLAVVRVIRKHESFSTLIFNDNVLSRATKGVIFYQREGIAVTQWRFQLRFHIFDDGAQVRPGVFTGPRVIRFSGGAWFHRLPPHTRIQVAWVNTNLRANGYVKARIVFANEFGRLVGTIVTGQLHGPALQVEPDAGFDEFLACPVVVRIER